MVLFSVAQKVRYQNLHSFDDSLPHKTATLYINWHRRIAHSCHVIINSTNAEWYPVTWHLYVLWEYIYCFKTYYVDGRIQWQVFLFDIRNKGSLIARKRNCKSLREGTMFSCFIVCSPAHTPIVTCSICSCLQNRILVAGEVVSGVSLTRITCTTATQY
jgi:hypothetical protein